MRPGGRCRLAWMARCAVPRYNPAPSRRSGAESEMSLSIAETAGTARPFAGFDHHLGAQPPLRAAISAAKLRPERDCVPQLIEAATLPPGAAARVRARALQLVSALRATPTGHGIDGLIHEYSLSSEEGVALMCLAEALLRIPDKAGRDALIRDKVATGDWLAHVSRSSATQSIWRSG